MLQMKGIAKRYGQAVALESADLAVSAGEVMALMGENGAGKSTLVKILAGLETPDAGHILIDGNRVTLRSPKQARAAGIGYVAQELSIIPTLSVAENTFLGETGGIIRSPRVLARRARPFLEKLGLSHVDPSTMAGSLSVAERQLVEIARLLSRQARIAILDEPTAALSDSEIIRVKSAVATLASQGCAVVYVTHRMPEVFDMSNRVTVLRNGRSYPDRKTSELTIDSLIEQMLGRHLENMFPHRASQTGNVVAELSSCVSAGLKEPVSLQVRQGEILALAGQVGSGANLVLRMLAGLAPLEAGTVDYLGKRFFPRGIAHGVKAGIAYCSDDRKHDGIFAVRKVPENLTAPALGAISRFAVLSGRMERDYTRDVAEKFGIDEAYFSRSAGNLSGGNQQKVALGKWIGIAPRLLLVEEPTRGVDVGSRAEIYRHLRDLTESGLAVIFASSDTQEVLGLADRIATFFHGKLVRVLNADGANAEEITKDVTQATGVVQ